MTDTEYKYGFKSDLTQDILAAGINPQVIQKISEYKKEPNWLLQWRLKAFSNWQTMTEPHWSEANYPPINYQKISYLATPKASNITDLSQADPEVLNIFNRLGIPIDEQKQLVGIAVDAILDSVSIKTTFHEELKKQGIIFCSFSQAVHEHPELIQKYLGSVVPPRDNFFACLNSAVFSDGTFVYIPAHTICPMELSSYFRLNASGVGQFERTLIIAEPHSSLSYLEGCSAPQRDENQLHAAVVEIVAGEHANVKYSTVQNWYPGDKQGKGGVYNFVTKRGLCEGHHSHISWTQVETGSAITWKYPSVILKGDYSTGDFFSVTTSNHHQQADTGTKMTHLGKHTKSRIISKGISKEFATNTYRGLVKITSRADFSQNFTRCDSLVLSPTAKANTIPTIDIKNQTSSAQHEAFTSNLSKSVTDYLASKGLNPDQISETIIQGYCQEVLTNLPMEFAVEAKKLLSISLE